jgi:hypothetical protein
MGVYKRSETKLLWMNYTDENGKRHQVSTGTDDPALAESMYQQAVAEVALKKASQLASSVQNATTAKLNEMAAASDDPDSGAEVTSHLISHAAALEQTVAALQEQFDNLFAMFLHMESGQKRFARLLAAAVEHLTA